jgi:hypothetical protein
VALLVQQGKKDYPHLPAFFVEGLQVLRERARTTLALLEAGAGAPFQAQPMFLILFVGAK